METREFSKTEFHFTHTTKAYTKDGGRTWYWSSNDRPCPPSSCKEYGIPCDMDAQELAERQHTIKVLDEYARNWRPPTAEQVAEMVNVFGPGTEVVDVCAGRKYRLPG